MMRYIVHFSPKTGEAVFTGVDMGNGTKPMTLHASLPVQLEKLGTADSNFRTIEEYEKLNGHKPLMVIKIPGGLHWSRRGDPFKYHAAGFMVLEIFKIEQGLEGQTPTRYYYCNNLIDFPIREPQPKEK
jgi:hypothetical protein